MFCYLTKDAPITWEDSPECCSSRVAPAMSAITVSKIRQPFTRRDLLRCPHAFGLPRLARDLENPARIRTALI